MTNEEKQVVSKTIQLAKLLFGNGPEEYKRLLDATKDIRFPENHEVSGLIENGYNLDEALIYELKERYKRRAAENGFTEKHGLAVLEYASLLEELKG